MIANNIKYLRGDEPIGVRGIEGIVTAKIGKHWYDSYTVFVRHNHTKGSHGDTLCKCVNLDKPLSKRQLKGMKVL